MLEILEAVGLEVFALFIGFIALATYAYVIGVVLAGIGAAIIAILSPTSLPGTTGNMIKRFLYKCAKVLVVAVLWPTYILGSNQLRL